jgi:ADP-ribose pyrophosphatase YjhB (NUDIX family)
MVAVVKSSAGGGDTLKEAIMQRRDIRYQAAVIQEHQVLLLLVVEPDGPTFWVVPGGGREAGESEAACVCREVFEETTLMVAVERLLFVDPARSDDGYDALHTYLCRAESGTARRGDHPACDATIQEAGWFDLRVPESWPELLVTDSISMAWMERLRAALGYA